MTPTIAPLSQLSLSPFARSSLIETLCNLERVEYGEGMHRIPSVFSELLDKNDSGLICAIDDGRLIGYADVWQLHGRFYNQLLYGIVAEEEICAEHILAQTDAGSSYWYVGSVITDPILRQVNSVNAAKVFTEIFRQVYQLLNNVKVPARVMGVGSTAFGRKLLTRHGFEPISSSPHAIDFRPRFEKRLEDIQFA